MHTAGKQSQQVVSFLLLESDGERSATIAHAWMIAQCAAHVESAIMSVQGHRCRDRGPCVDTPHDRGPAQARLLGSTQAWCRVLVQRTPHECDEPGAGVNHTSV